MIKIKNKKNFIIGIVSVAVVILTAIIITLILVFGKEKMVLKQDRVTVELGHTLEITVPDFVEATDEDYENIKTDTSEVDTNTVGTYTVNFTYKKQIVSTMVDVVDTTVPLFSIESTDLHKRVGESLDISEITYRSDDLSHVTVTFEDGTDKITFDKCGEIPETLISQDAYGNRSKADINIYVTDANNPEIAGVRDLTTTVGSELLLKDGITVTDVEDGDLTGSLTAESTVDYNIAGVYTVTYTVADASGNKSVADCALTVTVKTVVEAPTSSTNNSSSNTITNSNTSTNTNTKYTYDYSGFSNTSIDLLDGATSNRNTYAEYINSVLNYVNQFRAEKGVEKLTLDENLCLAASVRATEMARSTIYGHTRPDGRSCFTVLTDLNINTNGSGENIAMGQTTPYEVSYDWYNSKGHYDNMTKSEFHKMGIGCASDSNGTLYWVQMFTY